jgi:hypothetical protein
MNRKTTSFRSLLLSAAALSMVATPALANHNWGWGGRHHRDRVDAGDVLTGILIIGGIAAIASAASSNNNKKRQRYERREESYPDQRDQRDYSRDDNRPEWQDGRGPETGGGINSAINRCMSEVSRGSSKVQDVDSVAREGDGWRVMGSTTSGSQFSCAVDRDGRIRNVNIDGRAI